MAKLIFEYSVSHDHSETITICWYGAQVTFHIIITVGKVVLLKKMWNPW